MAFRSPLRVALSAAGCCLAVAAAADADCDLSDCASVRCSCPKTAAIMLPSGQCRVCGLALRYLATGKRRARLPCPLFFSGPAPSGVCVAARKTLDLAHPDAGRSCAAMRGHPAATACASWSAGGDSQAAGAAAGVEELVVQRSTAALTRATSSATVCPLPPTRPAAECLSAPTKPMVGRVKKDGERQL